MTDAFLVPLDMFVSSTCGLAAVRGGPSQCKHRLRAEECKQNDGGVVMRRATSGHDDEEEDDDGDDK